MTQRIFIPGSQWLYFKIYTGIKTADATTVSLYDIRIRIFIFVYDCILLITTTTQLYSTRFMTC